MNASTMRRLTITHTTGVQVLWNASWPGQVEEVVELRIPAQVLSLPVCDTHAPAVTPARSRSSVDTLQAVEGVTGVVHEYGERGDAGVEKTGDENGEHRMHGPVLGVGVLLPVLGKEKGEGVELGILTPHALYERGYGEKDVEGELGDGRMGTPGAFVAAERVLGVTTHSPPTLVVITRPSLRILHVFPPWFLPCHIHPQSRMQGQALGHQY
ncbi:hypothetical protein K438DRAFT_1777179 [Mycena galopus ATCC 62051]|nr:hypothetical protein K438DRAFT_1777179 [Mycena galopus ATCC 62051]